MFKTLLLSAIMALSVPTGEIFSEDNYRKIQNFLESYIPAVKKPGKPEMCLKTLKEDGTWPDVDYNNKLRGAWKTQKHMERYTELACEYYRSGDGRYLEGARKALKWWYDNMPICPNWWYNEIGIPRAFAPATILIKESLPQEDIDGAIKILGRSRFRRQTAQNKLWQSMNIMMKAYLAKDEKLLFEARDSIASTIKIEPWAEGIQPDWSFHQHGPQLQWGNYGGGFAVSTSWLLMLLKDSPLALSEEHRSIIEGYLRHGVTLPIWKGYLDMNCCGRQLTKGTQERKAKTILAAAKRAGVEPDEFTGGRYFPYVDFGIYRTEDWYASVRMQSLRTIGMEQTNSENMRGRFAADGALLVRRDGDEYKDVAAAWNWHHVPGVTCHDDGKEIFGWEIPKDKRYNRSENVSGEVDGEYMVVRMELIRDGLTAHKAWFFHPGGIVCLGAGISMEGNERVITGVEQCRIKGDIETNSKYIFHNGITYIPLKGKFKVDPATHSGDWGAIAPSKKAKISTLDLLDIYFDHGTAPSGASYAYAVAPGGLSGKAAYNDVKKNIKIISNTPGLQSVSINGKVLKVEW